jgi:pimeloyl-ACP methyl ester carboxylesterase
LADQAHSVTAFVDDWLPGRRLDTRGRKKVVFAAGIMSRSGEALRLLGGFTRYLESSFGFSAGDFLEVSYHSEAFGTSWRPAPYAQKHCEISLSRTGVQVARSLDWYRTILPDDTEYHLVGYSLGGVVLFEAAARLIEREPQRWRGRLGSVITLSAPLFGADLGLEGELLGAFGLGILLPRGEAVRELVARGGDPAHRARVELQAQLLRASGVRLLTLADSDDVVVTPEDAVIAPPVERQQYVLAGPRVPFDQPGANPFGHGPLLRNTLAWVRMAKVIGQQTSRQ